jgi:DNA repair protein RadA/Sms
MAKEKTVYTCQSCGYNAVKWQGKCPSCNQWNTFVEEKVVKNTVVKKTFKSDNLITLGDFDSQKIERITLPDKEFNRVTGNGIVPGSVVLIGGEPGIGKSTLLLQIALKLQNIKTLYVSGEESSNQLKLRAERISIKNHNCFLLTETNYHAIDSAIDKVKPDLVIIDSIQTMFIPELENTPGSVSQIRENAYRITNKAKSHNIPVILIGHITKDGYIAGPKILEHVVDTVLYFEGDRNYDYRILRAMKNRFGSVSEIGIYEMSSSGLSEIENPSEVLLSQRDQNLSGISIAATVEGIRPFLIESQALVSTTHYGMPQRTTTGFDSRRLSMLLAVLEKRCGLKLSSQDVFLNMAGGIKVEDPSVDLGVASSIVSSLIEEPVNNHYCFAGEIGLSGEIRPVKQLDKRIGEAEKLGFKKIFISSYNKPIKTGNIEIVHVDTLQNFIRKMFK